LIKGQLRHERVSSYLTSILAPNFFFFCGEKLVFQYTLFLDSHSQQRYFRFRSCVHRLASLKYMKYQLSYVRWVQYKPFLLLNLHFVVVLEGSADKAAPGMVSPEVNSGSNNFGNSYANFTLNLVGFKTLLKPNEKNSIWYTIFHGSSIKIVQFFIDEIKEINNYNEYINRNLWKVSA